MVERKVDIKVSVTGEGDLKKLDADMVKFAQDTKKADAAVDSFEKQQKEMGRTVDKNGLIFNKTGKIIVNATNNYRHLKNEAQQAGSALKTSLTPAAQKVSGAVGGIGRNAGQAGIQVQQFVGQLQGGQSAMLALSQQGADLGFVLGSPLAGAFVGITATIVGFILAMDKGTLAVEKSSDAIGDLVNGYDKMTDAQKATTLDVLTAEIKVQENAIKELTAKQNDYARSLSGTGEERSQKMRDFTTSILKNELALAKNKNQLATLNGETAVFNEVHAETEEQITDLIAVQIHLANTYGFSAEELALYEAGLLGANEVQLEAIRIQFARIQALKDEEQAVKDLTATNRELHAAAVEQQRNADKAGADFDSLLASMLPPEEKIFAQVEKNQAIIDNAHAMGLISDEQAAAAKLAIWGKYYADLEQFQRKNALNEQISAAKTINTFVSGLQQLNTKSDGLKRAAIVSSTAVAVMETYARVPPPWGIPLAAVTAAVGLKQFAQVGKSSIGGASAPTAAPASAGLTEPTLTSETQINNIESSELLALRNELANLDPDEVLPVGFTRRIMASLNSATAEGTL